ncbi:hypothetical protein BDV96DRAFT_269718 [Lophiotrema nucula]|uniref:Uncharacterized protein n=1 Tax=Lophiotrema nucula TaxID=690887 RepID=A0A6A5ZNJ1_9PLEO|nr:hypothetical protein BDV96DRAFT_269718 [Lophiotrema nucula]
MSSLNPDLNLRQVTEPGQLEMLIPGELKLEILGYIRSPSDLKALCLTSKLWQSRACPLLYRHIEINPRLGAETERFKACIVRGARNHLKHTQSLSFIDSITPPLTQHSTMPERAESDYRNSKYWEVPYSNDEMRLAAQKVFELFPDNVLTTFRFLSQKSPSVELIDAIYQRQKNIEHFHMTLFQPQTTVELQSANDGPLPLHCSLFYKARTLDLRVGCVSSLNTFSKTHNLFLSDATRKLERFSLWGYESSEFDDHGEHQGEDDDDQMQWIWNEWVHQSTSVATVQHANLRQVSLRNVNLRNHRWFLGMVDLKRLTHLILWNCEHINLFLRSAFQGVGPLPLKHLAIGVRNDYDRFLNLETTIGTTLAIPEGRDLSFMGPLIDACESLESLHLLVMVKQSLDCTVSSLGKRLGPKLRSFGLESHVRWGNRPPMFEIDEFEQLCLACPGLEQLGYRVKHDVDFDSRPREWTPATLQEIFVQLEPLSHLRNLKILHLRQPNYRHWGFPEYRDLAVAQREYNFQYFANSFFTWLEQHDMCPGLKVLVLGSLRPEPNSDTLVAESMDTGEFVPQQCFVRGKQTDCYGRSMVVGTPTPLGLLRREDPETLSLLDWDPIGSWPGRILGRFNDN